MQTSHLLRFRAQRKAAAAKKQTLINTDFTEKKKSVKSPSKKAAPKKSAKSVKSVAPKKSGTQKRMAPKKRTK